MARKIVITSGKGGVGKTTVCCNLGVQLARLGYRVIVADLDFGLNNVDVVLGVENRAVYDVSDAVEGRCRARQVLSRHPEYPTLFSVSSNRVPDRYVSPQAVRLVLDTLSPQFDFILIDSPAGILRGGEPACYDAAHLRHARCGQGRGNAQMLSPELCGARRQSRQKGYGAARRDPVARRDFRNYPRSAFRRRIRGG